jgi:hypothetical protein
VLTKELLQRLSSLGDDVLPKAISDEACAILRHFPALADIEQAHQALPELFGPVPLFSELSGTVDTRDVIAAVYAIGAYNKPLPEKDSPPNSSANVFTK